MRIKRIHLKRVGTLLIYYCYYYCAHEGEYVFAQTSMVNEDFRLAVVKGNIDKVKQMIESGSIMI